MRHGVGEPVPAADPGEPAVAVPGLIVGGGWIDGANPAVPTPTPASPALGFAGVDNTG